MYKPPEIGVLHGGDLPGKGVRRQSAAEILQQVVAEDPQGHPLLILARLAAICDRFSTLSPFFISEAAA